MAHDTDSTTQTGNFYSQAGTYTLQSAAATGAGKKVKDSAGNPLIAMSSSSFSTLTATNHGYTGTPTGLLIQENNGASAAAAAAAMSGGTITATQYTPAGTANACTAVAYQ